MNFNSKLTIKIIASAGAHICPYFTSFDLEIMLTVKYEVI